MCSIKFSQLNSNIIRLPMQDNSFGWLLDGLFNTLGIIGPYTAKQALRKE